MSQRHEDKSGHGSMQKSSVPDTGSPFTEAKRSRTTLLIVGTAIAVIVIALTLGLGLGLGLRKHHGASVSPTSPPSSPFVPTGTPLPGNGGSSAASGLLEEWRLNPESYVLDTSWNVNAASTTRYYNLVISEGQGWPDGVVRDMLFINGKFPGPLIEVNRGDRLVVNVTNNLSKNSTTIHWHGLFQNGTNWFDGTAGVTQCGIPPGRSLLYNFTIDNQFGTYWYHSHYGTQYLDGVLGPLVVHAPEEADARKLYDQERVALIQDWYHDFSTVNLGNYLVPDNENSEPLPDNGLINGFNYFNCSLYSSDSGRTCFDNNTYSIFTLDPNTRTRVRLINTGAFAEFQLSVDNHSLSVIEADGTLVNPYSVHRLPIHVAQRYSVVLTTNQSTSTNYWLRAAMNTFCFTGDNPVLDPTTLAVVSYSGNNTIAPAANASIDWKNAYDVVCEDLDPSFLVPSVRSVPPPATTLYRVDFSFGIGAYQLDYAKVNGTTWAPMGNTTTLIEAVDGLGGGADGDRFGITGQVGAFEANQFVVGVSNSSVEVVDVLIYSLDEGSHPFHLHGHQFWILQTGSGFFDWKNYYSEIMPSKADAVGNALRRDTLTIKPYAWALIRFVADNPGLWALHCHIAWHMEAGLLMQFMSRADVLRKTSIPQDVRALCEQHGAY
ncbi:Multicopper like protein [Coniochaeta hoffmannii]|uniref:Multicopper like protein n=1 Tax=Coniochaeta hoffmannii TaxID=91930 RepID=A0AA38SJ86_9PEZI|nr:Multicopper like protein [Coniochaeta hoffmannii]